jgi:hypothetical protein
MWFDIKIIWLTSSKRFAVTAYPIDQSHTMPLNSGQPFGCRVAKRVVVLTDAGLCVLCVWSRCICDWGVHHLGGAPFVRQRLVSILIALPIFIVSGLYRAIVMDGQP